MHQHSCWRHPGPSNHYPPPSLCTTTNHAWVSAAKETFMLLRSKRAEAWTSSSPRLQQSCGLHCLPTGVRVPAPLPILHRLVEQGCKAMHASEWFMPPRKAVCHTPHALQILAVVLPAWWDIKGTFTDLHPLHNYFPKGWLTILYQTG